MTDPRIAPVEDSLFAFWERAASHPMFRRDPASDVLAVHTDIAFPLFNAVVGAPVGQDAPARSRELAARYVEAGLPWLWWLTPSTTSPDLEAALADLGLMSEPCPGMYRELGEPTYVDRPAGIEVVTPETFDMYLTVFIKAFGLPDWVAEPIAAVVESCFADAINAVALLDGRPVACGTAFLSGTTAGLYNIGSLPGVRGRGAGYAVTASLLDLAAEAGATHAVLHSSEDGFPLYRRLGFDEVCQVTQYVWVPAE
jgi:ribosomal protein S18 acetylase RimI-like enzyme